MKKYPFLVSLIFIGLQASSFASFFAGFNNPDYGQAQTISRYIYVSGSGYSPNTKPYRWQATPPSGPSDWITNDVNQTNVKTRDVPGGVGEKKSWAATGGVLPSTPPAATRTELWHQLSESGHSGHVQFSVEFAVIASTMKRVNDSFGWAFKDKAGAVLFQIQFKPASADPRGSLEVWEYDRNGVGTITPLTIAYDEKYHLSVDLNLASRTYRGTLSSRGKLQNFSGTVNKSGKREQGGSSPEEAALRGAGGGKDFVEDSPQMAAGNNGSGVASVAAVWSLNGPGAESFGNNYMVFTDYSFVPEPMGQVLGPGGNGERPPVINIFPPSPTPVTSH